MAQASASDPPIVDSKGNTVARAAVRGTLVTLVLRLVSFGCTQLTLRLVVDPKTLGRASIELELLLNTVLFLSREGFRLALTRNIPKENDNDDNWNVAWLSVPSATFVSLIALVWHLRVAKDDADYRLSGILYCLACCIEGWAEPAALAALRTMNVALKASAEGIATVGKTVATVVALYYFQDTWPVTAFGFAQMVYALIYATFLYYHSWPLLKAQPPRLTGFHSGTSWLVLVFTVQGLFKHFLTEGDKIVLATLSGAYDQGVYAMASGFGGMAARILLQPLEENARLLWSRQQEHALLEDSYTVLVKLVLYVGFVFSFLAVNYTSVLLNVVAGPKWGSNVEASNVLSAFSVYTAFLAWNGMTEAFVYAAASSGMDVGELGVAHTVVGLLFAGAASVAVSRYGTVGLVGANCIAMFSRAVYSVVFAARYFGKRKGTSVVRCLGSLLARMFPNPVVTLLFVASFVVTWWSQSRMMHEVTELKIPVASPFWWRLAAEHVAVGGSCSIGILSCAYWVEVDFRSSLKRLWHEKQG